jgi:hypothetical protein
MAVVQHITCNQLASSLVEINMSLFCEQSELNELMDCMVSEYISTKLTKRTLMVIL